MYALEWISKSHLVDVWNPPNPQSHVTENQWEKSLFLVFVSLSARYCLVIPQMDWAWLDSRFVRAQRFVKAPISVNLSQKSALSSGILNRLKIFFPLLIRMSSRCVIWHQSNPNSCKVKENRRRGSVGKILKSTLRNCRVFYLDT